MSATLTKVTDSDDVWGRHRVVTYDVTLDSSYPSGGYAITAANVGLRVIETVDITPQATGGGYDWAWDVTNSKMRLYQTGGFTPGGTLYISGGVGGTIAIGISSQADNSALSKSSATDRSGITGFVGTAVAASGQVEVATSTSLTGVIARCRFIGN